MRKVLYLPLPGIVFNSRRRIAFGGGFSVEQVPSRVLNDIKSDADMVAGYKSTLAKLAVTLAFRPAQDPGSSSVLSQESHNLVLAVAQLLRLATDVPLTFPWWLYYTDNGYGWDRTQIHQYRHGQNYTYPIDVEPHLSVFRSLRKSMPDILSRIRHYHEDPRNDQRFVRAVEAAAFAFQTRHVPPRLVNMVTFQEILFSTDRSEITHQLAERIAWYLNGKDEAGREDTYKTVKSIYRARSTIVHGDSHWKEVESTAKALTLAEHLNAKIVRAILAHGHVAAFSESGDKRRQFLERLGLGLKM